MPPKKKSVAPALSEELRAVERRRRVIMRALISDPHSIGRSQAKDDILRQYPSLRPLVTVTEPEPPASHGVHVDSKLEPSAEVSRLV